MLNEPDPSGLNKSDPFGFMKHNHCNDQIRNHPQPLLYKKTHTKLMEAQTSNNKMTTTATTNSTNDPAKTSHQHRDHQNHTVIPQNRHTKTLEGVCHQIKQNNQTESEKRLHGHLRPPQQLA